nr:MAG TPA: Tubulin alpha-1B chain, Tubulin beta-2B, OXYGEN TRANSPORT [Caudoviricetes sp.]DAT61781.1 MAG TPA: Tubulin alpha-1B chain, Tubulin beta-2B, OXYGEN TRANSPORT [Caudoviricetes sp.]
MPGYAPRKWGKERLSFKTRSCLTDLTLETPPRVWGRLQECSVFYPQPRNTPTYAGNG